MSNRTAIKTLEQIRLDQAAEHLRYFLASEVRAGAYTEIGVLALLRTPDGNLNYIGMGIGPSNLQQMLAFRFNQGLALQKMLEDAEKVAQTGEDEPTPAVAFDPESNQPAPGDWPPGETAEATPSSKNATIY